MRQHKHAPPQPWCGTTYEKGAITMASTKVIATTWAKKDLLNKLKATIKRMDDEIVEWNKIQSTLKKRQEAWDKKAEAWAKKNVAKADEVSATTYHNRFTLTYTFNAQLAEDALGERPDNGNAPRYKQERYDEVSEYNQVLNAIALVEGGTDTEFKITTSSTWASFIR